MKAKSIQGSRTLPAPRPAGRSIGPVRATKTSCRLMLRAQTTLPVRPGCRRGCILRASFAVAYRIEVVDDLAEFGRQRDAWDAVASRFETPLLSHDWFVSCAASFGGSLHVVECWSEGRLAAAAPLVLTGPSGLRRLEVLGARVLFEPTGFIYECGEALSSLCRGIARLALPMMLHRLPRNSPVQAALTGATEGRGWWASGNGGDCPLVALPATFDDYLQSRSPQRRYDLRRAHRRLEAMGSIDFRFLAPAEHELDGLLRTALAVESSGWKGRAGSAIETRPEMRDFIVDYSRRACRAGQLRIGFLDVDCEPAAVEIGILSDGRFWVLKIGYDERWASASPGLQLLTECIRESIERGCVTHEFLGTSESWIEPWADERRQHDTLRYYPQTWRGIATWSLDQARRLWSAQSARTFRRRRTKPSASSDVAIRPKPSGSGTATSPLRTSQTRCSSPMPSSSCEPK